MRVVSAAVLAVVLSVTVGEAGGASPAKPRDSSLRGVTRTPPVQTSDLSVPDESPSAAGAPLRLAAPAGKLLLLYFGYTTCPDVCPTTLADLGDALRRLGPARRDVQTAMMTIDPERDTGARLSSYLRHFVKRRYHALRTTDPSLQATVLARLGARADRVPRARGYDFEHTAIVYVLDDQGTVVVEWPFGTDPRDIAHDLRVLLRQHATEERTADR
jgi:protein SCO1/2